MPKVLLTDAIHPHGAKLLEEAGCEVVVASPRQPAQFRRELEDSDALVVRTPVGPEVLELGRRLRVLARHGVGLDPLPLEEATARGIPVVFTPGANTESVAQHTIGVLLALVRQFAGADRAVRAGDWDFRHRNPGRELNALRLGIVGLGRIGRRVAEIAHNGFGMEIHGYDPYVPWEETLSVPVRRWADLDAMLRAVDVVSLHAPLTPETRGLFDRDRFRALRPGAYLLNLARGPLVVESALLEALAEGRVRAAALDVFDEEPLPPGHPYTREERILLTPHSAALTEEALERMATTLAADIVRVLRGQKPHHLANPEVWSTPA